MTPLLFVSLHQHFSASSFLKGTKNILWAPRFPHWMPPCLDIWLRPCGPCLGPDRSNSSKVSLCSGSASWSVLMFVLSAARLRAAKTLKTTSLLCRTALADIYVNNKCSFEMNWQHGLRPTIAGIGSSNLVSLKEIKWV